MAKKNSNIKKILFVGSFDEKIGRNLMLRKK